MKVIATAPAVPAEAAMRAAAAKSVADRLNRANLRIAEVEGELRRARQEGAELGREVEAFKLAFAELATEPAPFMLRTDAARAAAMTAKLSLSQRREIWLQALTQIRAPGAFFQLYPHDGGVDPLTILALGTGGFGDVIAMTPILAQLRRAFAGCRLFAAHQHSAAEPLLSPLPFLDGVATLGWEDFNRLAEIASVLDVFDLVVDCRYALTYCAPPKSRVPFEFLRVANARAAEWQRFTLVDWPHLNNDLARLATARGMGQLDLAGYTGNIAVTQASALHLAPSRPQPDLAGPLTGLRYATVHHGADPNMSGGSGVQTKNLPIGHWRSIVAGLKSAGLAAVQLGEAHEEAIGGVDVDFRGKLNFREAAYVIKFAAVHIDTEGGLVHAARAMFTPSVVAFGPTPVDFFGYAANFNIAPRLCGGCWWTTDDWSRRCPRELADPECMDSQKPAVIVEAALRLAGQTRWLSAIPPRRSAAGGEPAPATATPRAGAGEDAAKRPMSAKMARLMRLSPLPASGPAPATPEAGTRISPSAPARLPLAERARKLQAEAGPGARGLVLLQSAEALEEWKGAEGECRSMDVAVAAALWRAAEAEIGAQGALHAIFDAHLPIETDAYDWIVGDLALVAGRDGAASALLVEAGRCVKPGGRVSFQIEVDERGEGISEPDAALGDGRRLNEGEVARAVGLAARSGGVAHLELSPQLAAHAPRDGNARS